MKGFCEKFKIEAALITFMHSAKFSIDKVAVAAFSKKGPTFGKLAAFWKSLLSKDVSSRCFPYKITSHEEEGHQINTLHIYSEDSYTSILLTYNAKAIIEKIAVFLGGKQVNRINVKTIGGGLVE